MLNVPAAVKAIRFLRCLFKARNFLPKKATWLWMLGMSGGQGKLLQDHQQKIYN